MTIASPETAGPNITSGTEIKFSTLRKYFLKMKPRSSFTASDTFESETGSVSASQLLRVSSLDSIDDRPIVEGGEGRKEIEEEYDIDYLLPYVPDCTENSNIATENNWKTSQFVGSIKYYYLRQSTSDDLNLNLSSQSWNNNLPFTIRKWFFIDGTIGSNTNTDGTKSDSSLIISSTTNYLTLKLSSTGKIYGSAGAGGTNGVNDGKGGDGGDAISWTGDNSLYNNYVIVHTNSQLYGGGGGGGKGGNGGQGGTGGAGGTNNINCTGVGAGGYSCTPAYTAGGTPGAIKIGPDGPTGRGYSNLEGPLGQNLGGQINPGQITCQQVGCPGGGGNSGSNGNSGSAGNWAEDGNQENSTDGTRGINGGNGSIKGTVAVCGGGGFGHFSRTCHDQTTFANNSTVTNGTSGAEGGSAGKAIFKGDTTSFILIGEEIDNIKGDT